MTTVKIVLRQKASKDNTFPLAIRITKDRKTSFIHLGKHVHKTDWDAEKQRVKKSHPNSTRLNNFLLTKLAEANDKSLELETQKNAISSKAVKQKLKPSSNSTFFAQGAIFMTNLRTSGKYNRVTTEEPRLKQFKEFLKGADITFQEIDVALLNKFRAYLKGVRKVSERTIMNYLILIRTIYNQAIEAGLADRNHYPFGRGKITIKFPQTLKIGLNEEEVSALEKLDLSDDARLNHARNVWLFSYYFAGIRAGDVLSLRWPDFQDDRLYYSMNKNDKPDSLKVSAKALRILDQYKGRKYKYDLVFPELTAVEDFANLYEVQRKTAYADKNLNDALKKVAKKAEITKPLTMHISRHTFGNISGDAISLQMLQKLYRHSHITTTIGYQSNFIHKDVDDALDAVINKAPKKRTARPKKQS